MLYDGFLAFPRGPGGFRELQEAGRIHLHLSWYLFVPGVTSYNQKPWGILLPSTACLSHLKGLLEQKTNCFRKQAARVSIDFLLRMWHLMISKLYSAQDDRLRCDLHMPGVIRQRENIHLPSFLVWMMD